MVSWHGSRNNYFFQFSGWSAQLVSFQDDSLGRQPNWTAGAGELRLLPRAQNREITYGKKTLYLDAFFRAHRKDEIDVFRKLQPGTWLIVSGELIERQYLEPYPDLKTTCYIKGMAFDPSKGALSPARAHLYAGNNLLG